VLLSRPQAAPGWDAEKQALLAEVAALRLASAASGSGGDELRRAQAEAENSTAQAAAMAAELAALRAATASAAAAPPAPPAAPQEPGAPSAAEVSALREALQRLQGENASLAAAAQAAGAAADAAASALAAAKQAAAREATAAAACQPQSAPGSVVAASTPPASVVGCGPLDLKDQMARLSSLLDGPAAAAAAILRPAPSPLDRRVEALAQQFAELTKRAELDAAAAADVEAALVERCAAAEAELDTLRAELAERDEKINWARLC